MSVGPSERKAVAFAEPDPAFGSMLSGKGGTRRSQRLGNAAGQHAKGESTRTALRRPFGSSGASPYLPALPRTPPCSLPEPRLKTFCATPARLSF